jgi:hypothetical protein
MGILDIYLLGSGNIRKSWEWKKINYGKKISIFQFSENNFLSTVI